MRAYQAAPGSPRASAGSTSAGSDAVAPSGKMGKLVGEQVEQEKTKDKLGRNDAEERASQDSPVGRTLPFERGQDAEREADNDLDNKPRGRKRHGCGQAAEDDRGHRLPGRVRLAQVPVQQAHKVAVVLHDDGAVQAEHPARQFVLGVTRAQSGVQARWVDG